MLKPVCGWLVIAISLLLPSSLSSEDFTSAVSQFAWKIANRVSPETVSLTVRNQSSLDQASVSAIGTELQRQLQSHGWKLKNDAENSLAVTFAQNIRGYVWTAELTSGAAKQIIFFEVPRSKESGNASSGYIPLSRTLLISSDIPLLDAALLENKIAEGSHLLALTPNSVQLYMLQSSQWRLVQTQSLGLEATPSRDLRGRIAPDQGNSFDAYLPGLHCTGVVTATLSVTCRFSDDPWPLSDDRRLLAFYAANHNYFNGVVSGTAAEGENAGPFYSAAILSDRVVYAGTDRQLRIFPFGDHGNSTVPTHWGSSIAAIQSSCQSDLILATAAGDFFSPDTMTAFRPSSLDFSAASEAIAFPGAVVSLKTSSDRQQGIAVVASPAGPYEAYLLTARCSS